MLDEAAAGDAAAARERLQALQVFPLLDLNEEVGELAAALVTALSLPPKSITDAAHIAIAAVHGMHFLLTWNCTHIANAEMSDAGFVEVAQEEFGAMQGQGHYLRRRRLARMARSATARISLWE